jgi:hypothetical protein
MTLRLQNEPDCNSKEHESCVFSESENYDTPGYYKAFDIVYDTLQRNMINAPGMIGPEASSFDRFIDHPYAGSPRIEAIGNHVHAAGVVFKNGTFFENLNASLQHGRQAAQKAHVRKVFVTESANVRSFHSRDPLLLARTIYDCLEVAHAGMFLNWDLIWSRSTALGTLLLVDNPFEDQSRWRNAVGFIKLHSFYWFQHFTIFVREGMFKVPMAPSSSTPSNILSLCFSGADASTALILINEGTVNAIISIPTLPPPLSNKPYRRYFSTLVQGFTEDPVPFSGTVELPTESITTIYSGHMR